MASEALAAACAACTNGAATRAVSDAAERSFEHRGATSLFKGYRQGNSTPFPGATCVSVNDEVVHGIPGPRRLAAGDLVTIDVGIRLDGWCADMATSVIVGGPPGHVEGSQPRRRMVDTTKWLLAQGIAIMRPGVRWSVVGELMERLAEASGFGIVTEYVGHGIGRTLHEPPKAPAYHSGFVGADFALEPGMVLAVEPMLTLGRGRAWGEATGTHAGGLPGWRIPVRLLDDGWTVVTQDGLPASHEERMVLVTQDGSEVLGGPLAALNGAAN